MPKSLLRIAVMIVCILFLSSTSFSREQSSLTLEQKIGQMLMVGFRGFTLDEAPKIKQALNHDRLGGVILFDYDVLNKERKRNIKSPAQINRLTAELQKEGSIAVFIAVDQEGGRVARLNEHQGFYRGIEATAIGRMSDEALVVGNFRKIAQQLVAGGININLAPVVDLCSNAYNPIIAKLNRCYSADSQEVIRFASLFIRAHAENNILTALKHFPGHGSSNQDSHLGFVDISETWSKDELKPYSALMASRQADMVMVAHVFNRHLDANYPASLSYKTITNLLVETMGYHGIIISDDLQMGALRNDYTEKEILFHAIHAGNDILVFGNNLVYQEDIVERQISLVMELISEGKISEERIDASWHKIQALKARLR